MKLTTEAWSITERAYHNGQEKVFPYGNRGGNTELEWATLPITIQNLFNLESAMTLYVQKNSWLVLKSTFHWKTNRRKSNFLNCHSLKILIFFCLFFTLKVYFNTLKDHVMYLSVDISSSKWHFQKHLFREWWVIYHIEIDIKPCVVSFLPLINYWLSLCYYCSPPVSFFQNYLAEEKTTTKTKKTVKSSQHSTSYHTCTENEF